MAELFYSKIAGVTYNERQEFIKRLKPGQMICAIRDINNQYDDKAIALYDGIHLLGFINKNVASSLADKMDSGYDVIIYVDSITGEQYNNYGANIRIELYSPGEKLSHCSCRSTKGIDDTLIGYFMNKEILESCDIRGAQRIYVEQSKEAFSNFLRNNFHP